MPHWLDDVGLYALLAVIWMGGPGVIAYRLGTRPRPGRTSRTLFTWLAVLIVTLVAGVLFLALFSDVIRPAVDWLMPRLPQ